MKTTTTGHLVMWLEASGTQTKIGRDLAPYDGTLPELNCRRLQTDEAIDLTITDPAIVAITDSRDGYGCGWGGTTRLFSITEEEVEGLRHAAAQKQAALAARRGEQPPEDWRSPRGLTLADEMDADDSDY